MANADTHEPQGQPAPRTKTGETVTVGCKLPNGLVLHLDRMVEFKQPVMGGGIEKGMIAQRMPETFTLNGCSVTLSADGRVTDVNHLIIGGYGITPGIPKDFWDKWLEANKDTDFVVNRQVFAASDEMSARSVAIEQKAIRSGLEPLDPANPAATSPELRRVQPGTRTAA
jgi:hypothetical protein